MFHQTISPLQLYKPRNLDGLLESNRLTNAFQTQPVEMAGVLAYMFATNPGKNGNVMGLLTTYMGNTEYIDNAVYRWRLYTGGKRIIDIAGDHLDGGLYPGIGKSTFRVPLAEPFFEDGDVVFLDDNMTQLRVQGDHYSNGDEGYIYTFRIMTENPKKYVEPRYLTNGARMTKDYNIQPEFSDRGSGISMNTGLMLENRLGIFRKSLAITRGAQTDVMAVDLMTADGKKTRVWDTAAAWQAAYEFAQEVDTALFYGGKLDGSIDGVGGRPVFQGAGFRQQIAPSNRWEYSKLTYDYIDNFFTDLSFNANANGGSKEFVVLTGQQGMKEVNRVLKEAFGTLPLLTESSNFLGGSGDDLQLKGHFSRVRLMNGVEVSWKLFEPYDDRHRNRLLDPKTGYPLESFRHTIMNVGSTGDGKANIQKIVKKDSMGISFEVGGSTTAAGTRKGGQAATGKDGREMHWIEESGLKLNDPTSCGEMVKVGTPLSL